MNYWIFGFLSIFWIVSIVIGWKFKSSEQNVSDFLIGKRKLSFFIFIFAITSILITNVNFFSQSSLNLDIGFMGSYLAFTVIITSIVSIFFMKKQWVLSKRFGYITPAEMYGDYFKSKLFQYIIILISIFFIIPFVGLQLSLGGKLLSVITENLLSPVVSSWIIGLIICVYVGLGGTNSVAHNNAFKFIIIIFGLIILGLISYNLSGGFMSLNQTLAKLSQLKESSEANTISLFYIPEIINSGSGYNLEDENINWSGTLIFGFVISTIGIFCSLALYYWAPIADELKKDDRNIVLNSIHLKWKNIEKEFSKLLNF